MQATKKTASPQKASDLEGDIKISNEKWQDRRSRRRIQKRELRRILTFFMWANAAAGAAVILLALIEHKSFTLRPIITDKVVIAALAGITLQSGAIIIAAFKGLFSEK